MADRFIQRDVNTTAGLFTANMDLQSPHRTAMVLENGFFVFAHGDARVPIANNPKILRDVGQKLIEIADQWEKGEYK